MTRPQTPQVQTPDEYLARLPEEKRVALEELRQAIRESAPQTEECISYGLPSFRLNGRTFVSYGAAARRCAFYIGSTLQNFGDELKGYQTSKGTIRFSAGQPLPKSLVRRLVKERLREKGDKLFGVGRRRSRENKRAATSFSAPPKERRRSRHLFRPERRGGGALGCVLHGLPRVRITRVVSKTTGPKPIHAGSSSTRPARIP